MSAETDKLREGMRRLAERRAGTPPIWPLLLIAAPAAVAVWSGWVGLGQLCGFGVIHPLPGIWDAARLNTAITLPVGVEAYGAYALTAWLRPGVPENVRRFARWSALGSLGLGMAGQGVFHLLSAEHYTRAPAAIVVLVACLPVVSLGLGTSLAHMLRTEQPGQEATIQPPAAAVTAGQETTGSLAAQTLPQPSDGHAGSHEMATPAATGTATEPATATAAPVASRQPVSRPPAAPASQPRRRAATAATDSSPDARAARRAYRKSAADGAPLSDRALGAKYSQTRAWGAARIREVKEAPVLAEAR